MSDPKIVTTTQNVFCTPVDITGDDTTDPLVQNMAMVTLDDATDPVASGMIRMVLNFTAFIVMLLIIGFGMPYIYDVFIFEFIKKGCELLNVADNKKKEKVYAGVVSFFVFIAIIFILLFTKYTDATQLVVAMFTVIFWGVSIGVLYLHITDKVTTALDPNTPDPIYATEFNISNDIGSIIGNLISFHFFFLKPEIMSTFIPVFIVCFFIVFLPFYFTGLYAKNTVLFSFLTYCIPCYLANFIATMSTSK